MDSELPGFIAYTGLRYGNSFIRIRQRCSAFQWSTSTIGSGTCTPQTQFETFSSMTLCICATNNCNQDRTTCEISISNTSTVASIDAFIPTLSEHVPCNFTNGSSLVCTEQPYVNSLACEQYVRNNSLLCAITMNGTQIIQTALVEADYERYLSEKVYQLKLLYTNNSGSQYNETTNNVYYKYSFSTTQSLEECACTNSSFCNSDMNTCALLNTQSTMTITSATASTQSMTSVQVNSNATTANSTVIASTQSMTSVQGNSNATAANSNATTVNSTVIASTQSMTSVQVNSNATTVNSTVIASTQSMTSVQGNSNATVANSNATTVNSTVIASTQSMTSVQVNSNATTVNSTVIASTQSMTSVQGNSNATVANSNATTVNSTVIASTQSMTSVQGNSNATAANSNATTVNSTVIASTQSMTSVQVNSNATTINSTVIASTQSMTSVQINSNATVVTNTTRTTTTATTSTTGTTSTTSLDQQNLVTGEPGLGKAATAGIVCGIIFSALLFIGEILFFKFVYSRMCGPSGTERSVAYHADG
ncbi:hypothetical protein I4U23_014150 [Adineta vaga]|nr:hypothetical protein I4U23_014150 [Adineta vaga]